MCITFIRNYAMTPKKTKFLIYFFIVCIDISMKFKLLIFIVLIFFTTSCGYKAGYNINDKRDSNKVLNVFIDFFNNKTLEPRLEDYLIEELKREFIIHPNINIVFKDEADFIINGDILDFKKQSISYSTTDKTLEYRLEMTVKVLVKDKKGKILNQKVFQWNKEYVSGYTGSRNFDVGASEAKKKEFIKKICYDLSGNIYHWLFSNNF